MLIIGNGRMITRDASKAFIENGAVAMDGNTIVMVGTTDEVKERISGWRICRCQRRSNHACIYQYS